MTPGREDESIIFIIAVVAVIIFCVVTNIASYNQGYADAEAELAERYHYDY